MSRRVIVAVAAIIACLTGTLLGTTVSAQAAGTAHGCPAGAVCIYARNAGWNGNKPSVTLWSYGPHNLSNEYGNHYVLNNQTDDHGFPVIAVLCKGYNGTKCTGATYYQYSRSTKEGVSWGNPDLTAIDSVILSVFGP